MFNLNLLKILLTVVFESRIRTESACRTKSLDWSDKKWTLNGKLRIFQIFRDIGRPEDTNSGYLTAMLCGYRAGLHGYAVWSNIESTDQILASSESGLI